MIETIRYRLLMRRLRGEIAQALFPEKRQAHAARGQMSVKSTCKALGSIV